MSSKGRLFAKALIESPVISNAVSSVTPGSTIAPTGILSKYDTVSDLPLTGNNPADQAYVAETNRLYLWTGTGWYNIALINTSPSITGGYESSYIFETDGTPIEITLVGSDPEGIPLTWSYEVTSGSLTNGGGQTATVSNVDNVFTITPSTVEDYGGTFSLTFKASDGVNLGTAVSSFTLQFRILNNHYNSLLVKNIAVTQNATFVDSSTNNHTITANGDVYQGTFSPYSASGHSTFFDGDGDYLSIAGNNIFNFATNDFTIEAWVYLRTMPTADNWPTTWSGHFMVAGTGTPSAGDGCNLLIGSSRLAVQSNDVAYWSTAHGMVPGTWYHITVSRSSGTLYFFVNGIAKGTTTLSGAVGTGSTTYIGCETAQGAYFNGYIHNLRVINGTALYTTAFTPPETVDNITNTSLLTCHKPYNVDSSNNAYTITFNGNATIRPVGPFDYQKYRSSYGGSAYFDGSGDYLTATYGTDLSLDADFTVECWVYMISKVTAYPTIVNNYSTYGVNGGFAIFAGHDSGTAGKYNVSFNGSFPVINSTDSITYGSWQHVALVRSGTTLTLYINGISNGSSTQSATVIGTSDYWWVGAAGDTPTLSSINGYISNLRVVKGTAVYTGDFTPSTAPLTEITNTSLLLNFTNAGIQDYSQSSDLKLFGNAISSNAQTKYAPYSTYLDGTGDWIEAAKEVAHFGPGNFTIEGWWYFTTVTAGYQPIIGCYQSADGQGWGIVTETNNALYAYFSSGTSWAYVVSSSTVPNLNAWNHIAVVRNGTTLTLYLNGTSIGSATIGTNSLPATTAGALAIGYYPYFPDGARSFNGYVEDVRITKGLARYTANFTPPTIELLG